MFVNPEVTLKCLPISVILLLMLELKEKTEQDPGLCITSTSVLKKNTFVDSFANNRLCLLLYFELKSQESDFLHILNYL